MGVMIYNCSCSLPFIGFIGRGLKHQQLDDYPHLGCNHWCVMFVHPSQEGMFLLIRKRATLQETDVYRENDV